MKRILGVLLIITLLLAGGCKGTVKEQQTPPSTTADTVDTAENTGVVPEEGANLVGDMTDNRGVWYEIFVRSFADGNGDGVGDFVGLTNKLDYLNDGDPTTTTDLGVDGIWLMPINASGSYHGYDVEDYYVINPDYGTMEEFETFLAEAEKRGIQVIMDLVVNHTSSNHPWFKDAKADPNSPYRDYYSWINSDTEGYDVNQAVWGHKVWNKVGDQYYYGIFWSGMPDLNYDNQKVRDEVKNIAGFWLDKGVDGFRIDAAMHIYGNGEKPKGTKSTELNLTWWNEFDDYCRTINPNYYLVGEVWVDIKQRAAYAEVFNTTFNFDVAEDNILSMVRTQRDLNMQNDGLITFLEGVYEKLDSINPQFIDGPFLTNHDQDRSMSRLDTGDINSMELATGIMMTLPGNAFMYYGEELGMLGSKPDERIREPFVWGSEDSAQTTWESMKENVDTVPVPNQQADAASLLNFYKEIIRVRQANEALTFGDFDGLETTSSSIVAYKRSTDGQTLYIVHNLLKEPQAFDMSELVEPMGSLVYASNDFTYQQETIIEIPAQTTLIFSK